MENNQENMTYYFITDGRKMSKDDFLRLEQVAGIEAKKLNWKLFVSEETHAGKFYLSLN